ncbi:MAG: potassium transporter TrkA, partial [Proteobacteria bacterium]|nr:potassium transporter TrkA [Pseudomonadota bacterium]
GEMLLPPPFERPHAAGDQIVAVSEDDSTLLLDGQGGFDRTAIVAPPAPRDRIPERTLVLGSCTRLGPVLTELDAYVAAGSTTIVVGEVAPDPEPIAKLEHMTVDSQIGDITDRLLLESLDLARFDHILVLSESANRSQEMADARTTVALLHLRDIARREQTNVPITSEILDIQNRDLAAVAEADDFIVSNTLVSLMVSQIAENPHLVKVFDELFSPSGHELYLKPASEYVTPGEMKFGTVCEAAMQRNQVAIGYRLGKSARDPLAAFGVVVNPSKRASVTLGAGDKIIVLADS